MRLQRLTGLAAALTLAAGVAGAAPFRIVTDEPGSAWVLDAGSGALTRCTTRTAVGAKVLDVFGDGAEARPQTAHMGRTQCRGSARPRSIRARGASGRSSGRGPARSPISTAFPATGAATDGLRILDADQRRLAGEGGDGRLRHAWGDVRSRREARSEQGHQGRHHRRRRPDLRGGRPDRGREDRGDRREPEGRHGARRRRRLRHAGRHRPAHPSRNAVHGHDGGRDLGERHLRRRLGRHDDGRRLRHPRPGRHARRARRLGRQGRARHPPTIRCHMCVTGWSRSISTRWRR